MALGVLALLRARALGKRFHLPFGDGTVIAAAGIWAAVLIVVRLFDRPLGQNLLALACAAILVFAGARERAKRPAGRPAAGARRLRRRRRPRPPAPRPRRAAAEDADRAAAAARVRALPARRRASSCGWAARSRSLSRPATPEAARGPASASA